MTVIESAGCPIDLLGYNAVMGESPIDLLGYNAVMGESKMTRCLSVPSHIPHHSQVSVDQVRVPLQHVLKYI